MKKYWPLFLLLFIGSEAFLKGYLQYSPAFAPIFPQTVLIAGAILLLASACIISYLRRSSTAASVWDSLGSPSPERRWYVWVLGAILLLGFYVRLVKLGGLVSGMTYDEAYKGLDAIAIREFGERPIFLDWNGGREALVAYLVAASQKLFDYSILSVRIVTAVTACLALCFFYLFVKILFNKNVALLSTFLMAVSKYHIIHSRYGVRAGQFMVFELAVLYLVARGFASNRRNSKAFLLAGAITGIGFYTYIAYRIFPLILLAFVVQKNIRTKIRMHFASILGGALLCIVIVAPVAVYYVHHFDSFTERMKRTAVWEERGRDRNTPAALLLMHSIVNTAGMFTYKGDMIARHNVATEPMLSPFATSFFLLGLILTCLNIRKDYAGFLILYFLLGLLPGILSVDAPNAPRVLAAIPPVMLFVAFGILAIFRLIGAYTMQAGFLFLATVLAGNFYTGINDALLRYPAILDNLAPKYSELWGMDRDQAAVAELLNSLGPETDAYLSPQFFFHSTVEYLTYSKSKHKVYRWDTNLRRGDRKGQVNIVFMQLDTTNPWWLRDAKDKNFFKWWKQYYGMDFSWIHHLNENTYNRILTNISDRKLLRFLKIRYPKGKLIDLKYFSCYLVATVNEAQNQDR